MQCKSNNSGDTTYAVHVCVPFSPPARKTSVHIPPSANVSYSLIMADKIQILSKGTAIISLETSKCFPPRAYIVWS